MNALDELLNSTRRVPGITPDGMWRARAALDETIARADAQRIAPLRQPGTDAIRSPASRRPGGLRGKVIIGVVAVAAAAAAAVAVVLVPSSPHQGRPRVADSGSTPVARASKTPAALGRGRFSPATTDATATTVLHEAANAAGSRPGGWPTAAYWHVRSETRCGGVTYHNDSWFARQGIGVAKYTGGHSSNPVCNLSLGTSAVPGPATFDGYTWSQLYGLPTDPARLKPILVAKFGIAFSPHPTSPRYWTGQENFFESLMGMLDGTPASPALREALYEIAATIPGVTVRGDYTDSLGRTGTALRIGIMTLVVDPGNGQVLDEMWTATPAPRVCGYHGGRISCHKADTSGPTETAYISQGPAKSEPKPPKSQGGSGSPSAVPSASPSSAP